MTLGEPQLSSTSKGSTLLSTAEQGMEMDDGEEPDFRPKSILKQTSRENEVPIKLSSHTEGKSQNYIHDVNNIG